MFKGTEPVTFTDWKALANADWQPGYADLQQPEKALLHEALLREQCYCCCYCGMRIDLDTSHIEHFRPQERYPLQALEYENLHASCLRTLSRAPQVPIHCGHHKGNWFVETDVVSPLEADCEQRFRYALTGEIDPARVDDLAATKMIEILALDGPYLRNRRAEALLGWFDDEFLVEATQEELATIAHALRHDPQPDDFAHVVACYAEQQLQG